VIIKTVDASVAVKWFCAEDGSEAARRLRTAGVGFVAPVFVVVEVFHALANKVRKGLEPDGLLAMVQPVIRAPFAELAEIGPLADDAMAMARSEGIAVYDGLYIALAQRTGSPLITDDDRQDAAARRLGVRVERL
jgi:predicted nucleic acid-binding protein